MKTGFGSHCSPVKMLAPRSLTGQMKYFDRMRMLVKKKPRRIVQTHAPTKPGRDVSMQYVRLSGSNSPSTVFFGLSLINCVFPKVIPQIYAKMSLMMTKLTGRKNQIMPSKILFMMKCACTTIR